MIIGITGPARVGKDTVANYLRDNLPEAGWFIMSFAEPIKAMLAIGLGLSVEQLTGDLKDEVDPAYGVSPRHMMQTLGTDWGRQMINRDVWIRAMAARSKGLNVIIPDVRFESEAEFVRNRGLLLHVKGRGGLDGGHISEAGVAVKGGDRVIDNSGDSCFLYAQCTAFIEGRVIAPVRGSAGK